MSRPISYITLAVNLTLDPDHLRVQIITQSKADGTISVFCEPRSPAELPVRFVVHKDIFITELAQMVRDAYTQTNKQQSMEI